MFFPVRRLGVREQPERMRKRRLQHRESIAAAARRPGQVDHERPAVDAGHSTREHCVRRPRDRVGPNRLCDSRRLAVDHRPGCLGRDVSGWAASQDAMVAAVKEQARIEAAMIAQRQLGLGDLGDTGVVP